MDGEVSDVRQHRYGSGEGEKVLSALIPAIATVGVVAAVFALLRLLIWAGRRKAAAAAGSQWERGMPPPPGEERRGSRRRCSSNSQLLEMTPAGAVQMRSKTRTPRLSSVGQKSSASQLASVNEEEEHHNLGYRESCLEDSALTSGTTLSSSHVEIHIEPSQPASPNRTNAGHPPDSRARSGVPLRTSRASRPQLKTRSASFAQTPTCTRDVIRSGSLPRSTNGTRAAPKRWTWVLTGEFLTLDNHSDEVKPEEPAGTVSTANDKVENATEDTRNVASPLEVQPEKPQKKRVGIKCRSEETEYTGEETISDRKRAKTPRSEECEMMRAKRHLPENTGSPERNRGQSPDMHPEEPEGRRLRRQGKVDPAPEWRTGSV